MIIIVGTNRGLAWVPKAILSPSPSDMGAEKFPLVSMGGRAEGLSASGILLFSSSFFPPLFKFPEGVVVGFRNFAWAPN
jgi:hypothetical protein